MLRTIEQVNEEIRHFESIQDEYAARDMDEQAQIVWEAHLSPLFSELAELKAKEV